jgi:WD40 repeat protein
MALKFRQPEEQKPAQVSQNFGQFPAPATTVNNAPIVSPKATTTPQINIKVTPSIRKIKHMFPFKSLANILKKSQMGIYIVVAILSLSLEAFQRIRYYNIQNGTASEVALQSNHLTQISSDGKHAFTYENIQNPREITTIDGVKTEKRFLSKQYDIATGKLLLSKPDAFILGMGALFSQDGKVFAHDRTESCQVFDTNSMQATVTIPKNIFPKGRNIVLQDVANGGNYALFSDNQQLYRWDAKNPTQLKTLTPKGEHGEIFQDATISQDGKWVASLVQGKRLEDKMSYEVEGSLNIWNIEDNLPKFTYTISPVEGIPGIRPSKRLGFSNNSLIYMGGVRYENQKISHGYYSGYYDDISKLKWINVFEKISLENGKTIFEKPIELFGSDAMNLSMDGKYMITSTSKQYNIFDTNTGNLIKTLPAEDVVFSATPPIISADNQYLYFLQRHWIQILDNENEEQLVPTDRTTLYRQRVALP